MKLEEILLNVLSRRGVLKVKELSCEERSRVRELEANYSRYRGPFGRPVNVGVEECLKRENVFAALTSPDFEWPPGPYAVLKVGEREVGFITERGLEISRDALRGSGGEHVVTVLPLRLPELDSIADNCVVASPSPPVHGYLLQLLGGTGLNGTLLIGFDRLRTHGPEQLVSNFM